MSAVVSLIAHYCHRKETKCGRNYNCPPCSNFAACCCCDRRSL